MFRSVIQRVKVATTLTFFDQQETLESVKKCQNFLVTLIKLASSDPQAASMANNVKGLVKALLVWLRLLIFLQFFPCSLRLSNFN